MNTRNLSSVALGVAFLVSACTTTPASPPAVPAAAQPAGLKFTTAQLAGSWAESTNTRPVCTNNEIRYRYEFASDGKRLKVKFNRIHPTEIGEKDEIAATIIESTETTLTVAYDGETRRREDGNLVQWQLLVVAPGVYRWRETSWQPQAVNVVVGVKCGAA
jgi:hypothetical protein